ncbi:MAG: cysteine desulfurase [Deltaproteobacteria bacterium]|nr:cysteine desulfurase [Deltaproteobacteria bacterium]
MKSKQNLQLVRPALDIEAIRQDFPVLHQAIRGKPLVYLDNAASTQKPRAVIQAVKDFYEKDYSNIHRGVHTLSERATIAYESARNEVAHFLNAKSEKEIVFVRGATEAINLVSQSWGKKFLKAGDEVLISHMEHHANIVPWQLLREQIGIELKVIPITDQGELDLEAFEKLLSKKTKLLSLVHISNTLGTINPVKDCIKKAHALGIPVLIDGAQAVAHQSVDVQDLDADFYVFSSHKVFSPSGVGVLYAKEAILDSMPPYQGGGDMILTVSFEKTTYNEIPHKFEAGTPNIEGVIGLGHGIQYLKHLGLDKIKAYEEELLSKATLALKEIEGLQIIGEAKNKVSVISFVLKDIHPHDIGTLLDNEGVAVRTGHHCTMPLMKRLGLPATARASFAFYNTVEEIDALLRALEKAKKVFG